MVENKAIMIMYITESPEWQKAVDLTDVVINLTYSISENRFSTVSGVPANYKGPF